MYSCYTCIKLVINSTKSTIVYDENLNLRHTVDSLFLDALSAPRFSPRYPCKIHGIIVCPSFTEIDENARAVEKVIIFLRATYVIDSKKYSIY